MEEETTGRTVYIYALYDPREPDNIRYVGKTLNLRIRMHTHKNSPKYEKNNYRINWIKKLNRDNIKIGFNILEKCNETNAEEKEIFWIKTIKEKGYKLINSTSGGEGCNNPTPELRKKLSESHIGNKSRLGIPHTEETKKHLSNIRKGMSQYENQKIAIKKYNDNRPPMSEETKQKILAKSRGYKMTDEQKKKISMAGLGKKRSEETKKKMSESIKKSKDKTKKRFMIFGELLNYDEIEERHKIRRATFRKRIEKHGLSNEDAVTVSGNSLIKKSKLKNAKKYNFNGEELSLLEASIKFNMKFNKLRQRINSGHNPSDALLSDKEFYSIKKNKIFVNNEWLTLKEISIKYKICYPTLINRLNRGKMNIIDAIFKPVRVSNR